MKYNDLLVPCHSLPILLYSSNLYPFNSYPLVLRAGKDSNPRCDFSYSFGDCPLRPLEHRRIIKYFKDLTLCDYGWIRTIVAQGNLLPQFNFVKKLSNVFSSDLVAHPICFT